MAKLLSIRSMISLCPTFYFIFYFNIEGCFRMYTSEVKSTFNLRLSTVIGCDNPDYSMLATLLILGDVSCSLLLFLAFGSVAEDSSSLLELMILDYLLGLFFGEVLLFDKILLLGLAFDDGFCSDPTALTDCLLTCRFNLLTALNGSLRRAPVSTRDLAYVTSTFLLTTP